MKSSKRPITEKSNFTPQKSMSLLSISASDKYKPDEVEVNLYRKLWTAEDDRQQKIKDELLALQFSVGVALLEDQYPHLNCTRSYLFSYQRCTRVELSQSLRRSLMWAAWEMVDKDQVFIKNFKQPLMEEDEKLFERAAELQGVDGMRRAVQQMVDVLAECEKAEAARVDASKRGSQILKQFAAYSILQSAVNRADVFSKLEPLVATVTRVDLTTDDPPEEVAEMKSEIEDFEKEIMNQTPLKSEFQFGGGFCEGVKIENAAENLRQIKRQNKRFGREVSIDF